MGTLTFALHLISSHKLKKVSVALRFKTDFEQCEKTGFIIDFVVPMCAHAHVGVGAHCVGCTLCTVRYVQARGQHQLSFPEC